MYWISIGLIFVKNTHTHIYIYILLKKLAIILPFLDFCFWFNGDLKPLKKKRRISGSLSLGVEPAPILIGSAEH